jgi:hypothetical protein
MELGFGYCQFKRIWLPHMLPDIGRLVRLRLVLHVMKLQVPANVHW